MNKPQVHATIMRALRSAMEWEDGIADAHSHMRDHTEYRRALHQKEKYREVLRMAGEDPRSISEELGDLLNATCRSVSIQELHAIHEPQKFNPQPVRKRHRIPKD